MDTDKDKATILDRLDSVELKMLQEDTAYAKQYLVDEGVSVEEEQNLADQHIRKIQFMVKALSNKEHSLALLERAFEKVKESIQENAAKAGETLSSLLQSKTPAVQYRKLENWTDDEIRDVLMDVDLIRLMEELDKGDD